MKRHSLGNGIYKGADGSFWVRPTLNGKRTWRKLKALTERYALKEGRDKIVAHERSKVGTEINPFARGNTFRKVAELYLAAHCPSRKLEPRPPDFCAAEAARIEFLAQFFGPDELHAIKLVRLPEYRRWRIARLTKKTFAGDRTVEMDLCTLSNVLNYAVSIGSLDFNYIRAARPKFQTADKVRHCREFAPETADELHALAAAFMESHRSEVCGWVVLFTAMSGCRISEILRLRMDAARGEPGYEEGNQLFIRRSKKGINPFILITPEFRTMLTAFRAWHRERWPKGHGWFFPGRTRGEPLHEHSFSHAVPRCAMALGLPHRKAHGFRSFYVTKRRSDGATDAQIAREIGDKTAALIERTYGAVPDNWVGGEPLSFMPKKRAPAWSKWVP